MKKSSPKPRLAFWFRYGPAEHAELFHALPSIIEELSGYFEVYYVGFTSREKPEVPEAIKRTARVIQLPVSISRRSNADKTRKTLLWIALTPFIALACRIAGIRYVYVDETLPLVMPVGRLFYGNRITMTIADMFIEQYMSKSRLTRIIGSILFKMDLRSWKKAPFLFARSQSARERLAQLGIDPERLFYAYDAVDHDIYHPQERSQARAAWSMPDDDIVMVYHGVLNPAKDLDMVMKAMPEIVNEFPRFKFLIIGNGPEEARLRDLAERLNMREQVVFAGYQEPRDVAVALRGGDIGLISRKADLGSQLVVTSVLGHCLACGIAVLAARTSGIGELIEDGHNGLLFEPGDKNEFSRKLLSLCRDSAMRSRLALAGRATAKSKLSVEETTRLNTRPLIDRWAKH